jgi:hypothetical protein
VEASCSAISRRVPGQAEGKRKIIAITDFQAEIETGNFKTKKIFL